MTSVTKDSSSYFVFGVTSFAELFVVVPVRLPPHRYCAWRPETVRGDQKLCVNVTVGNRKIADNESKVS